MFERKSSFSLGEAQELFAHTPKAGSRFGIGLHKASCQKASSQPGGSHLQIALMDRYSFSLGASLGNYFNCL